MTQTPEACAYLARKQQASKCRVYQLYFDAVFTSGTILLGKLSVQDLDGFPIEMK